MKKTICNIILFVLITSLISCSSDDDSSDVTINTIKKIEEKVYNNGQVDTDYYIDFNYENNLLKSLSDSNNRLDFVYNGSKIIEIKRIVNSQHIDSNFLAYEGDLLKTIILDDQDEKTTFSYQNGVLVSKTNSYNNNGNWVTFNSEDYQIVSNNIMQTIFQNQFSSQSYKQTFEFDAKNSMMKNMNPYLKYLLELETCNLINQNNLIKSFSYDDVNSIQGTQFRDFVITYNTEDYPINIKKYNFNGSQQELISEIIITYN
ncbi:hypothetical protein [uncultured Flavobacterium sp.]|mgnify:CR=1 FL=1|uniref:hypothetical protein n=1 Tax=uncultured Flavobacterium sp. TaxID=165435 RepID=UPI0030ECCC40|tara:strand:- start:282942 stop:283721 length:780 start_codon:yes stop_codon:yes gene_type:complete